jgi:hypothetical protein
MATNTKCIHQIDRQGCSHIHNMQLTIRIYKKSITPNLKAHLQWNAALQAIEANMHIQLTCISGTEAKQGPTLSVLKSQYIVCIVKAVITMYMSRSENVDKLSM